MQARFEWDLHKNRVNIVKHGIDFRAVTALFSDPLIFPEQDREIAGEHRWLAIGWAELTFVVFVAHAIKDEDGATIIPIISARRAHAGRTKTLGRKPRRP